MDQIAEKSDFKEIKERILEIEKGQRKALSNSFAYNHQFGLRES